MEATVRPLSRARGGDHVATWQQQQTQQRGLRSWSSRRWLIVTAILVAIAVAIALLVLYAGGGGYGGHGGGGGY